MIIKDRFSPLMNYDFAWSYVQLYNASPLPWEGKTSRFPITLADVYRIIGQYLDQRDDLRYRKIDWHEFLYVKIAKLRKERDTHGACEPREGLHEFRLVKIDDRLWLIFPADLNSGWQSHDYKRKLTENTVFHGYALDRQQAIHLHDLTSGWQDGERILRNLAKQPFDAARVQRILDEQTN